MSEWVYVLELIAAAVLAAAALALLFAQRKTERNVLQHTHRLEALEAQSAFDHGHVLDHGRRLEGLEAQESADRTLFLDQMRQHGEAAQELRRLVERTEQELGEEIDWLKERLGALERAAFPAMAKELQEAGERLEKAEEQLEKLQETADESCGAYGELAERLKALEAGAPESLRGPMEALDKLAGDLMAYGVEDALRAARGEG